MSDSSLRTSGSDDVPPVHTLTDRVLARLNQPDLNRKQLARGNRRTPARSSLRRVFLEMGDAYRQYRGRTGAPISPEVKAAASHFRQEPSVASLVSVAARLDELHILAW